MIQEFKGIGDAEILIGAWITLLIGFMLIAFVVFLLVKAYNKAKPPGGADSGPSELDLLTEIRDNLAK